MHDHQLPPEARVGYAIGILGQLFQARVGRVMAPSDLTYSQFSVLSHLARTGLETISEIAAAVEINQPGATKIVQRLGERGLVSVEADSNDGRRRLVGVTQEGFAVLQKALAELAADLDGWFEGWSETEMHTFAGQAERLAAWLDGSR